MDRLNFSLPEFTRIVWVTENARNVWQPRIQAINQIWPIVEKLTVVNGIRAGCLQSIAPGALIQFQSWCIDNEQEYIILAQEGASPVYGNASKPYDPDLPWTYRVYMGERPKDFAEAWRHGNNRDIGSMLGYPVCCSEFFHKHWHNDGWRDLTYPMTNFQAGAVLGPFVCNPLLRHLGVRAVFHLPCSFACDETAHLGSQILAMMASDGYTRDMGWISEMLSWPVRWSSLHGVAIITTPAVKIITSSDALPETCVIDKAGNYPAEGASGNQFPFQERRPVELKVLNNWTENGFSNRAAMDAAHDFLLKVTERILLGPGKALDLGCGNGWFLDKLAMKYPFLIPYGVEIKETRLNQVHTSGKVYRADINNIAVYTANYEITFISVNRFEESKNPGALLSFLQSHTRYLLVYAYGGTVDYDFSGFFAQAGAEQDASSEVKIFIPKT